MLLLRLLPWITLPTFSHHKIHGPSGISQFIQDECEVDKDHSCAASKFFQAYRDWCSGAGRKPQSQASFKRSLEKITGVYQHRSSNGLQWHGIQPCLTYWCRRCRLCSPFWKLSNGIFVGTFRIGLHSLHYFLLLRERGILINQPTLVDTQPASSPCAIKTVNLTIIKSQSQARLVHDTAIGGPNRRPNRRPNYACCRNYNQTVALFCGVNALGRFLPEEPSPPRCATYSHNAL